MSVELDLGALIALVIVSMVFAGFAWERQPPAVVAAAGAAAFIALGLVPAEDALNAFANPAVATIAAMFVISAALMRTGVLEAAGDRLVKLSKTAPRTAVGAALGGVTGASAFFNNTPVVIVSIPLMNRLSRALGLAPSKLLMPLSFVAILGGTLTLIGTSTNLLVDGVARELGLAPFGLFEISGVGLATAAAGAAFLLLASRFLPDRATLAQSLGAERPARYLAAAIVEQDASFIGEQAGSISAFKSPEVRLLEISRPGAPPSRRPLATKLRAGDVLLIEATQGELLALRKTKGLRLGVGGGAQNGGAASKSDEAAEALPVRDLEVVEALVGSSRTLVGRRLGALDLGPRFNVYPIAFRRRGRLLTSTFEDTVLRTGDAVLFEGTADALAAFTRRHDFLNVSEPAGRRLRRRRAPIPVLTMLAVVALAAIGAAPIHVLALVGAAVVLATGAIDLDEALGAIDGGVLVLILSMLVIGQGLQATGAVALLVEVATPWLANAPPMLVLALLYAFASLLTELVTNNAVAVVVTPLAAALADSLGLDPRPFVVVVMFAASASFATPVGYQTNTIVYTAGGYRFADFLRIGVPLNVLCGAVAVAVIPLIWPLQP